MTFKTEDRPLPPSLIFLDFDGVLHAHWGPHSERFSFLPRFESVLRDFPDAQIVIASSWQLHQDFPMLRSHFSSDIQSRVIGVSGSTEKQALTWYGKRHRLTAAQRFLEANGYEHVPWVAIDDEPSFWEPNGYLIHCRGGFQEVEELLLRMVLSGELRPQSVSAMQILIISYFWNAPDRARRFFAKYGAEWIAQGERDSQFEALCATDPEFVDLCERFGLGPSASEDEEQ